MKRFWIETDEKCFCFNVQEIAVVMRLENSLRVILKGNATSEQLNFDDCVNAKNAYTELKKMMGEL